MNMWELEEAGHKDLDNIKANVLATACLMPNSSIKKIKNGNYSLTPSGRLKLTDRVFRFPINRNDPNGAKFSSPLANHEKFREEPAPGMGSGFLVGEDLLLTAGHCVYDGISSKLKDLESYKVVFRFHKTEEDKDKTTFREDDVYTIKKVINYSYAPESTDIADWALVQLDRKVEGVTPVEIDSLLKEDELLGRSIYAIGCPTGTAVKTAGVGMATIKQATFSLIKSDLDTLGGNSGGPVIDRITNKVIGILIRGPTDYTLDKEHLEKTGEKRVVNIRITPSMFNTTHSPAVVQRTTEEMISADKFEELFVKKARELRIKLSERNSEEFRQKKIKEYNKIKHFIEMENKASCSVISTLLMPIKFIPSFIRRKLDRSKLSMHEKIETTMKEYNINYKEAYHLLECNEKPVFFKDERSLIDSKLGTARNMSAYNIPIHIASFLHRLEIDVFYNNISPQKILDTILYHESIDFDKNNHDVLSTSLLKQMQKNLPYHSCQIAQQNRFKSIKNAAITKNINQLRENPVYENYTDKEINDIVSHYVKKNHRLFYISPRDSSEIFNSSRVTLGIQNKNKQ